MYIPAAKIKNPVKNFPKAPIGWYMSEKYDGYRAIWNGKDFVSRNNNIFNVPIWFKAWMPPSISLDGELFLGRDKFQKCGIFRKKVPIDKEWIEADVKYQIFDCPSLDKPFEERYQFINDIVMERLKCNTPEFSITKCPLTITKQTKVISIKQLEKEFKEIIKKKGEGLMLRCPHSPYEGKRTAHLLKYKSEYDDECIIDGYKEGTGKYLGKLGAFHCKLKSNPIIKFDISGMDDKIRDNYLETHPIGTIITFKYMGLTDGGVPRHPQYLRIRESE